MKLPSNRTKIKKRKVASWESKWLCYKESNPLAIGLTSITAPPSQRFSSPAFPFFGLDVTDILGSFEGCDGGAVIKVSPIARELLSL